MKVLINALLLNDKFSGVQNSIQNLLSEISKSDYQYKIEVLLSKNYSKHLQEKSNFRIKQLNFSTTNRIKRIYFEHLQLANYFKRNEFDLYHATSYISPYFSNFPTVLTVHDLISLDYPQHCKNETAIYYKLFLPKSIIAAKKIIAVSNTVKEDILRRFKIDHDKIDIVYHGIGKEFEKIKSIHTLQKVKHKYNLPDKFLLFVGNIEPKKNLENLIKAFSYLKRNSDIDHKLIIAGKNGWKYTEVYKNVQNLKIEEDVVFTGYIEQNDLPSLYSLSDLFVFPSLYEGFGLPVLEAMACETPILISDRGALPEIAGKNCIKVNPFDYKDMAKKIFILLTDMQLRINAVNYGIKRAKMFSLEKAAYKTLMVYNNCLYK